VSLNIQSVKSYPIPHTFLYALDVVSLLDALASHMASHCFSYYVP